MQVVVNDHEQTITKDEFQNLKEKKAKINNEIIDLRKKKALYNECLDLAYDNKSYKHLSKDDPLRLVNNIYSINKKLNKLRDSIDEINAKLSKKGLVHTMWVY